MSKLFPFFLLLIVTLFFSGCGGTTTAVKDNKDQTAENADSSRIDDSSSNEEKLQYAETLFETALSKGLPEKNALLTKALSVCSQILTAPVILPGQSDYTLQLMDKIMSQIKLPELSHAQNNQYLLGTATINLTNYQAGKTLQLLAQNFDSSQAEQWSMYHKLRAMAHFQLGQKSLAIKELIIRHGYLSAEPQKQENQYLIWKYLATLNDNELNDVELITGDTSGAKSKQIYIGWLELAKIFRGSHDPQTMNHATNFWLQNYPAHQADRAFINHIIRARQESVLNLKHIAVLLPLQGKLEKPSKAIRDGIMASHYQSPLANNIQLRFYDTSDDEHIWLTYQQAIDNGAEFIIGPLEKNNVEVLSESVELAMPTLALNSIEKASVSLPNRKTYNLFQFALSPEAEARLVAEKGRQDGHYYAAVMAPDNLWGKRIQTAFTEHWQQLGGVVVESIVYKAQSHDFSESIKSMLNISQSEARKKLISRTIGRELKFTPRRRQDIDMLFMAAFPRQAKQIPLQVTYHHGETIPIYSTAHIVDNYHNAKQNIDMDGVNFSDMPFLLGAELNAASLQNTYQNTLYQRLFAMGVDSYQLAPYVNYLSENPSESFAGDTGQITINPDGHIIRTLPWAIFEQGNVKLHNTIQNRDNAALY